MKNKFSIALTLAVLLALVAATFVFADNLFSDGDGLTPVVDTPTLALGDVCVGSTTTKPIAHAINRNGNYPGTNVYKKGTNVNVTVGTITGSGLSANGGGTIALPTNWDTIANNTLSPAVFSNVTFVANTLGAFSGTVNYSAAGTGSDVDRFGNPTNPPLTRADALAVTANVVNCDTTPPSLSLPDDFTAEATSAAGANVTFSATATDANPLSPTVTCSPASGALFALDATTKVTCSATDTAGNKATGSFYVSVDDTTPPSVTAPTNISVEAVSPDGANVSYSGESASDLVDSSVYVSCAPASGSTFAVGSHTVTCSATDAHGNTGTANFTVEVTDLTAPVLVLPGDITAEATGPNGANVDFLTSASDVVDDDVEVACTPASGSLFELGTTEVECSAADSNGNIASDTFNVTVEDTIAPSIDAHGNETAEATSGAGASVTYTNPATHDAVSGNGTAVCTPASGSGFALGTTAVICSASDAAGNTSTSTFDVTVQDTKAPSLTLPADQQLEATGPGGATAIFSASASDLVDGSVAAACDASSGATFPLGTTTVTCSATDAHGNKATGTFVIIVEDTTAPSIDTNNNLVLEATGPSGAVATFSKPAASDLVDTDVSVSCAPDAGSMFALGHHIVTCTATDNSNNSAQSTFDVFVRDTTAPSMTVPSDITKEATSSSGATVSFSASANDIVDGSVTTTCTPASGSTFPLGTTLVTCTASDTADNSASKTFNITVEDTTAPSLSLPLNITKEATGSSGAAVSFTASANDIVDGSVTPTCTPASGSTFALGSTSVNCSATDAAGNQATGSFSITVQDTTAPALSLPSNMTVFASGNSKAVVNFTASATDLVDGSVDVSCYPASGSFFSIGTTTVNCSATDAHNNTATGSFTITVSFSWNGFFQPIDNNGIFNVVKAGSTIPVKFSLGGDQGLSVLFAGYPMSQQVACPSSATFDPLEEVSTATVSGLRYDSLANQYIYNWKTASTYAGTCRQLNVKLADGSIKTALFKFTK